MKGTSGADVLGAVVAGLTKGAQERLDRIEAQNAEILKMLRALALRLEDRASGDPAGGDEVPGS